MEFINSIIEYYTQLPKLLQIVWVAGFILFQVLAVMIIYLKFLRGFLRSNDKTVQKFEAEYENLLINFLYADSESDSDKSSQEQIINRLKFCVTDKFKRDIVKNILLKLKNEISGEMVDSIHKLYRESGMVHYATQKLKSKNWYTIAQGIRELTQFKVKEAHDDVVKFLNHPKREVAKEVQLYLVTLFGFKELDFLKKIELKLTEWDQIQLLEILQRFENQDLPDISSLFLSKNDSVVSLAIKLAKMYNLYDLKDELLALLQHNSKEIRVQTIDVLNHLFVIEAKPILKENFKKLTSDEQEVFLKMLENIADETDEDFVFETVNHPNFNIKYSALKILKSINFEKFISLKSNIEQPNLKMVEFVENN